MSGEEQVYVPGAFSTGSGEKQAFYRVHKHGDLDAVVDREGRNGWEKRARMVRIHRNSTESSWPSREDIKEAARRVSHLEGCTVRLEQGEDDVFELRVTYRERGENVVMGFAVALENPGSLRASRQARELWRELQARTDTGTRVREQDLDRLSEQFS